MSKKTQQLAQQTTKLKQAKLNKQAKATRKQKMLKTFLAGLALLLIVMGAAMWWGYKNRTSIFHWMRGEIVVNRDKYPIVGIDVSVHNGDIDFNKVKADGYSFVFIKASEGVDHHDSKFDANYQNARQAGLKVGAYHFFRKNTDGLNQAKNFLETIGWRKLDLPLVIDVEDWSNDKNVKDDRTQRNLDTMIDNLRSRGHKVMIYTNGDGYKKYIKDGQVNINLWLCAFKSPDKIKHIPHQMQQYSHWGRVKGIWGDVDLNVFNGSQEQWDKWLKDLEPYQPEDSYIDSTLIDNDNETYIIDDEI